MSHQILFRLACSELHPNEYPKYVINRNIPWPVCKSHAFCPCFSAPYKWEFPLWEWLTSLYLTCTDGLTEAWVPLRFLRVWVLEQMLLFCLMYHRIILQEKHAILLVSQPFRLDWALRSVTRWIEHQWRPPYLCRVTSDSPGWDNGRTSENSVLFVPFAFSKQWSW